MKVLVVNSGSSSLKAQVIDTDTKESFANAYCERIGLGESFMTYKKGGEKHIINHDMPNHKEAFQLVLDTLVSKDLGVISSLDEIGAVGHRLVNFGDKYNKSIVVDDDVYEDLKNYIHYSPLHNNAALLGIRICLDLMPGKKNVAVFDTSFHATMPEKAYMYAVPYEFYEKNKIRRYGAHGTSHRFIATQLEEMFGSLVGKKVISCHLGSGSSICAIKDGKCVDTSMGYTPLAGLVMGTRSGDLDPSVIKDLMEITGKNIDEITNMLNKRSGLLGICGYSDLRDVDAHLDEPKVKLAFDMLVYSIKKYIGAYAAAMNGVDYLVFTAGVGENDYLVREAVCKDMEYLGIELDYDYNKNAPRGTIETFSKENSKVKVLRIPTNEELMIAIDTEKTNK